MRGTAWSDLRRRPTCRLALEPLEDRELLAGITPAPGPQTYHAHPSTTAAHAPRQKMEYYPERAAASSPAQTYRYLAGQQTLGAPETYRTAQSNYAESMGTMDTSAEGYEKPAPAPAPAVTAEEAAAAADLTRPAHNRPATPAAPGQTEHTPPNQEAAAAPAESSSRQAVGQLATRPSVRQGEIQAETVPVPRVLLDPRAWLGTGLAAAPLATPAGPTANEDEGAVAGSIEGDTVALASPRSTLPAGWAALDLARIEGAVDTFFAHVAGLGNEDRGQQLATRLTPWLVVAALTTGALEIARRQTRCRRLLSWRGGPALWSLWFPNLGFLPLEEED